MPGSPTVRRWVLGNRLRSLREAKGMSLEEVADRLLCSTSKISRLETAARGATLRDVRDLALIYGASSTETNELMTLVREANQRGWWESYDEVASRASSYIGLEEDATSIEQYETSRVPGLLQTEEYTRALMRGIVPSLSTEAVEQFVETRRERQRRSVGRVGYWVILDEAVVRRQVGGPDVMQRQIDHLIESATRGVVTIQLVPFDVGAHAGMEGAFTIFRFQERLLADVVYVEGRSGQLFLHRPADLAVFRETLDHLRAVAESPAASLRRLRDLLAHEVEAR